MYFAQFAVSIIGRDYDILKLEDSLISMTQICCQRWASEPFQMIVRLR